MANNSSQDPKRFKIFPRNLTARADFIVRGNPANTRLESGVDNCYPGLEVDQRNLDKAFFPGLVFEFHRSDGAILHQIVPGKAPAEMGLVNDDLPLYLWAALGRTTASQSLEDPPVFAFQGLTGLEVWRRIHDFLPGRIAILLGPGIDGVLWSNGLRVFLDEFRDAGSGVIERGDNGNVDFAVFVGERAQYLDEDGVIDIDAYQAGDLTRTLCVPWQYDFRDCGCFYWAANKPDLVASADGEHPYLNFMRREREGDPPATDLSTIEGRRAQELDYADLIRGAWNTDLPVVLNDRESEQLIVPELPAVPGLMNRESVITELRYLATVEHALCVEYLYGHYSLNAPMKLPETGTDQQTQRIFAAANEIFMIAVDEMRHLRWVNEALNLMEQPPSLERAERIGRQLDRTFELTPLTPEQLQWFIDVERPSQIIGGTIDGMYVQLHVSIDRQPELFPERDRLIHLIKLIIDEGEDHYQRFLSIQNHLREMQPDEYLRSFEDAIPGSLEEGLQQLSDKNYETLLGALAITFQLGDRASGVLLEQSRRAMFNLHENNHYLAGKGIRPRFTLPPAPPVRFTAETAHAHVDSLATSMRGSLVAVRNMGGQAERTLAEGQRIINEVLFDQLHQLIREDMER